METRFFLKKKQTTSKLHLSIYIFECKWRNIQIFDQGVNFKFTVVSWISKGSYHQGLREILAVIKSIDEFIRETIGTNERQLNMN
jgi:hypothetical protein